MIKKLIMSAVILTALIGAKESHAAGPGGFARALGSVPAMQLQLAQNHFGQREAADNDGLSLDKRQELLRVSTGVNAALSDLDAYLGRFDQTAAAGLLPKACIDCADVKREQLEALGWSAQALRIAYAIDDEGRIERVLVVSGPGGEIVLGNAAAMVEFGAPLSVNSPAPRAAGRIVEL